MGVYNKIRQFGSAANEELIYSILCSGISVSLIFWPLLNSILCIGVFLYWLFFSKKKFSIAKPESKWVILFLMLFLILIIGISYSADLKEGFSELQKKSALLFFPLMFGLSAVITPLVFRRTLVAFTWSTLTGCLSGIINGIGMLIKTGSAAWLYGYKLVVLKGMSPFILGLCCLLSLLYLAIKLMEDKAAGHRLNRLEIAGTVFLFIYLFFLGNRNLLFCLSAFFIYFCWKIIPRMSTRFLIIGCLGVLFAITISLNPYFNRQWKDLTDFSRKNNIQLDHGETLGRSWGGKTIRFSIWKCSWDIIQDHWLLGVGTGDVQASLQQAYEKRKFYFASRYNSYNAHNQYIQQALEVGILGTIILIACIFLPLLNNISQKNTLYTLFLLSFAFVCLTESMLEVNKGIIWYSFFNSIFMFRKLNT